MKAALLHMNLSGGPEEANLLSLERAVHIAAKAGATWIVTPETAVQGYFFAQKTKEFSIPVQPCAALQPLRDAAAQYKATLFLGCAEQDEDSGLYYNSCLVIGPQGQILGRHRKTRSHGVGAEAWLTKGDRLEPIECGQLKAGVLVCADAWYQENALRLKEKAADILVMMAAWPPGKCGPADSWERCSKVSGLPLWVCNQTGNQESLDLSKAESAVIVAGEKVMTYQGLQEAALLFEWDAKAGRNAADNFTVLEL